MKNSKSGGEVMDLLHTLKLAFVRKSLSGFQRST